MSRYCGKVDVEPKFNAINQWKEKALLKGGSILDSAQVWNKDNIEYLKEHFIKNRIKIG